jgi:hypothetical protein
MAPWIPALRREGGGRTVAGYKRQVPTTNGVGIGVIRAQARLRCVLDVPVNWLRSINLIFNLPTWQNLSENNLLTLSLNCVLSGPIWG